jgi:hypothetical protein
VPDRDRFRGVTVPDPGFAGDDGRVDPAVADALAAYAADAAALPAALGAVATTRLLVPVVAVLGEAEQDEHGLAREKDSAMAAVLLRGADGRLALLAFTGTGPLARWNPDARPVPVAARTAALAAVQEEAAALVVDVAGPHPLVVEGDDLGALAAGARPVLVGEQWGWVVPDHQARDQPRSPIRD